MVWFPSPTRGSCDFSLGSRLVRCNSLFHQRTGLLEFNFCWKNQQYLFVSKPPLSLPNAQTTQLPVSIAHNISSLCHPWIVNCVVIKLVSEIGPQNHLWWWKGKRDGHILTIVLHISYILWLQYMLKRDGDILRERWSYFDEAASANNFLLSSFANTVPLYFALFANNALN